MTKASAAYGEPVDLPVSGRPRERSDAARNRELILAAARRLFDEEGPAAVSMDRVAEEAGVGKGTLYRRFGDRAASRSRCSTRASASSRSRSSAVPRRSGGRAPGERIVAFGHAWLDVLDSHGDVVLAAESGPVGARFRGSVYASHRTHLELLLAG